jgi:hypothetical protein
MSIDRIKAGARSTSTVPTTRETTASTFMASSPFLEVKGFWRRLRAKL